MKDGLISVGERDTLHPQTFKGRHRLSSRVFRRHGIVKGQKPVHGYLLRPVFLQENHKALQGIPHGGEIQGECGDGADGEDTLQDSPAAEAVDGGVRHIHQSGDQEDIVGVVQPGVALPGLSPCLGLVLCSVLEESLGVGGTDGLVPGVEFLYQIVQVLFPVVDLPGGFFHSRKHDPGKQDEQGKHTQYHQREKPVTAEQIHQHGNGQTYIADLNGDIVKSQPFHHVRIPLHEMQVMPHRLPLERGEGNPEHIPQDVLSFHGNGVVFCRFSPIGPQVQNPHEHNRGNDCGHQGREEAPGIQSHHSINQPLGC